MIANTIAAKRALRATACALFPFLVSCAGTPERIPELEQARAAVEQLTSQPLAIEAAAKEMESARNRLAEAERALDNDQPERQIKHLAYLARTNAETGLERVEEARARQEIAKAEAARTAVLLEARTQEAKEAQRRAEAAKNRAEQATQLASQSQEQAQQAQRELAQVQQELQTLNAKQTERGWVMTLADVLFETDKAQLKPGAAAALDRLAGFMSKHPDVRIIAEGHADSRGPTSYNEQLSLRRAQAVTSALEIRGIDPARLQAVGRGESFPIASNDTMAGRLENRRVEILLGDPTDRLAESATPERR